METERLHVVTAPDPAEPAGARSRATVAVVICVIVAAGLAARFLLPDPVGDMIGGALYAGLIFLLCILVRPRARTITLMAVALAVTLGIELLQLTPWPAAATEAFWPSRLVLGTGFSTLDLVTGTVGVVGSALIDGILRSRDPWPHC